jgi:hypothetical protein
MVDDTGKMAEATHPPGIVVEIVGIDKGDRGRSSEEHVFFFGTYLTEKHHLDQFRLSHPGTLVGA